MKLKSLIATLMILILGTALPFSVAAEDTLVTTVEPPVFLTAYSGGSVGSLSAEETVSLRETIAKGLRNYDFYLDLSSYQLPYTQECVDEIAELIYYEIPEGFHFYYANFTSKQNCIATMRVYYDSNNYPKNTYKSMMQKIDAVAETMTGDLDGLGEVEKALLIHDRLAIHCEYAYEEYKNGTVYDTETFFNMYGPLVGKRGVCQGYAMAYMYLLRKVGIENRLVMSTEMNHSWNIVTIGGKEYHVDVTFDDPVEDVSGNVYHTGFLRSSNGIYSAGHAATDYDTTPTDTTYDQYFWQDSTAAFQLVNGEIYYMDNAQFAIKRYEDHSTLLQLTEYWETLYGTYGSSFTRLDSDGTYILYSTPTTIGRIDPLTQKTEVVAQPIAPKEGFCIYGFTLEEETLVLEFFDSPVYDGDTKTLYQQRLNYTDPITMESVILLLQYLTGMPIELDQTLMDRNADGALSIADAVMMLRVLAA